MKALFRLAFKSLINRKVTSLLCLFSITLSVLLFLSIEKVRKGAREGFMNTIGQTDLLVGAKGSPLQLLLYTVFHLGQAVNNIRYSSFETIKKNPMVDWAVPISLGDSYKGHRVVATNTDFFKHYRFRGDQGLSFAMGKMGIEVFDVVLGASVAKKFQFKLNDKIVVSHGLGDIGGGNTHAKTPFRIVGILNQTQTPVDQSVYITLEGMEAIHVGWENGMAPSDETQIDYTKVDLKPKQITSFFLRCESRIMLLRLRYQINQFPDEPLMASVPALALQELWATMSVMENVLFLVSVMVLLVGMLGVVIALYSSLEQRRREMAILRSIGMSVGQMFFLLVLESFFLTLLGAILGLLGVYALLYFMGPIFESYFSVMLEITKPSLEEWTFLLLVVGMGVLFAIIPAFAAYKKSLADGLTVKS